MAINLHEKYSKKIAEFFVKESIIDGDLNNEYSFSGVRTVHISTPLTVPMNDYKRTGTNRYGEPEEIQDIVQELTMTQDKSFSATVDKGNNEDQNGIKAAGRMMALQMKERVVPMKDTYTFSRLSKLAGQIVGSATALSKSNVVDRISDGTLALDDAEVPSENRTLYVSNKTYKFLKHSDEFLAVDDLAKEALSKGMVGKYDNMVVKKVPAKRWPAGVNFMIVYKNSATAPSKISDTVLHTDPPGISGNLLEGRFYYDVFVIGTRANGIYVDVDTSSGSGASVLAAPTIAAAGGTITPSSGTGNITTKFTTDGTDPRYSSTAQTGTAPTGGEGVVVKAYCYSDAAGVYPSPVAEQTLTS